MSNRSGSGYTEGSRLAAARIGVTDSPAPTSVPAIVRSSSGVLPDMSTGLSKRSISSTAFFISEGSAWSFFSSSGLRSSVRTPFPIRSVVVRLPAASSRLHIDTISSSVSLSPPSSAAISDVIRSARGRPRRSSITRRRYASIASPASFASWRSSGVSIGLKFITPRSDQRLKSARSAGSTPSISAITIVGSGPANASIRSTSPSALISSNSSSTISCILGRICSTALAVKALLTSPRSRVWYGGSAKSMLGWRSMSANPNIDSKLPGAALRGSTERLRSKSSSSTSSCLVST